MLPGRRNALAFFHGRTTLAASGKAVTANYLAGQPQNHENQYNLVTQYGYDTLGQRVAITDTLSRVTHSEYDRASRVTAQVDAAGQRTSYGYDPLGNRLLVVDPLGRTTQSEYDALNRVITTTRPLANVTVTRYDALGNRVQTIDARGQATGYGYDALNRNKTITDTLSHVTQIAYDAVGRRTSQTDPLNHSTSYGYDQADRQVTMTDALTKVTRYGYDGLGNRIALTDTKSVVTRYEYDALNRLGAVTENYVSGGPSDSQTNVRTTYGYDPLGRRTGLTDGLGHATAFGYDTLGRLTSEQDALLHTTSYSYDAVGRRTSLTDAKGQLTQYGYDDLDRLTSIAYNSDGTAVQFGYDALGNRTVMTDTVGTTRYSYNELYRLIQVTDPYSQTVGYGYDAAGNRTQLTYPDTKQVTYTYTPVNRLETVQDWASWTTRYGYDAASRPITATLPNGVATSYSYDNANRLTRLSHTTGGVTLGDYVFALDAVGNRTAITETVASVGQGGDMRPVNGPVQILLPFVGNQAPGAQPTIQSSQNPILLPFLSNGGVGQSQTGPTLFPIRPAPRVPAQAPTAAATKAAPPTKTAAPQTAVPPQVATLVPGKPRGELPAARLEQARAGASLLALAGVTETTTINYSYDRLYRVTGASYTGTLTNTFGYSYDAVGNRTVQTQTITSTLVTNYSYDIANRLTNVNGVTYSWDDNGNLLNDGLQAYTYDQANRLKQVVGGATTSAFGYNGQGDRLQQTVGITTTRYVLDPAAGLTQVLSDGTNTYLYGNGRVAQYQASMQYFGADGLGSVRQIFDATGQVVGSSRYDPYGNLLNQSGVGTSPYGFAGEWTDGTGLTHLRARYYSAAQGRFTTRDRWPGDDRQPMSYNLWAYAYANPSNATDPSGLFPPDPDTGDVYFTKCLAIHTFSQYFGDVFYQGKTAQQAVDVCRMAYTGDYWAPNGILVGFDLTTSHLPTTAHDLMGWFLYNKRLDGTNDSDRLFFDANQPLTKELARGVLINEVRNKYYHRENTNGPTEYPYTSPDPVLATGWFGLRDSLQNAMGGKVSVSLGLFMGSFYYQVKTTSDGRVGFRIDNDTTLASGSHIAGRGTPLVRSVEELILEDETQKNRPIRDVIKEHPELISILTSRTKGESPIGGGNLYQTFTWTEKYDCSLADRVPQDIWTVMLDLKVWNGFGDVTADPPDFPAQ